MVVMKEGVWVWGQGFLWLTANGMCEVSNTDTGAGGDSMGEQGFVVCWDGSGERAHQAHRQQLPASLGIWMEALPAALPHGCCRIITKMLESI